MKFQVVISFQFPYIHNWPGAAPRKPGECIGESFLIHPHRHLMKCRAWFDVTETDREVEFIDLKEKVEAWAMEVFSAKPGPFSCEQVAEALLRQFDFAKVEVLEDGENGAVAEQ